ncbi:MAG: hypothetical protein RRY97_00340 [Oscillibacter sp.]
MKVLFGIYMILVVSMFAYVGIVCIRKRHAPASGVVGLIFGGLGLYLAAAVLAGVI